MDGRFHHATWREALATRVVSEHVASLAADRIGRAVLSLPGKLRGLLGDAGQVAAASHRKSCLQNASVPRLLLGGN